MSFGFSVGDFVAAGQLAYTVWEQCKAATEDYKDLGSLCWEISVVVDNCRPNDPHSVLRVQHAETIARLAASCSATLSRLKALLHDYQDMSGAQAVFRKFGFTMTKSERDSIRSRLKEHLAAINTFLNGVQLETLDLTVKLLFKVLEGQLGSMKEDVVRSVVDNPEMLEELFKEVRSENKTLNAELDKDTDLIRDKLKEAAAEKYDPKKKESLKSLSEEHSTPLPIAERRNPITGPARPNSNPYDPWSISWFKNGGYRFLTAITAQALPVLPLNDPIMRYSKDDEWLCLYPEGWSMTRTMISRGGTKQEAIYFNFNNLSVLSGNKPRTTRPYFLVNPFVYDRILLEPGYSNLWGTTKRMPDGSLPPKAKFEMGHTLGGSVVNERCIGFYHNSIPYDLGDEVSKQLAMMQIGMNGVQSVYSDDVINDGLPDNWTWFPWIEGTQRNVYVDTDTETESTVHPARFYNSDDEVSHVLPPGWDRRLDSWGNLFFVDHHTHRAVREDPRFSNKIDQETGLPKGWCEIKDDQGRQYFYTKKGRMTFGTTQPEAMNGKSQKGWSPLSRIPQEGDEITSLIKITTPLALRLASTKEKAARHVAAFVAAQTISPMTREEEQRYHELFKAAPKSDPLRISREEALDHCKTFELPTGLVQTILDSTDANKDRRWNVNEYADALHMIHFEVQKAMANKPLPPKSPEDDQRYAAIFESVKKPESQVLIREDVEKACSPFDLPDDLIRKIFVRSDTNKDHKWNIDEFSEAMHRIMYEVQKREELSKFVPKPAKPDETEEPSVVISGGVAPEAAISPPQQHSVEQSPRTGESVETSEAAQVTRSGGKDKSPAGLPQAEPESESLPITSEAQAEAKELQSSEALGHDNALTPQESDAPVQATTRIDPGTHKEPRNAHEEAVALTARPGETELEGASN